MANTTQNKKPIQTKKGPLTKGVFYTRDEVYCEKTQHSKIKCKKNGVIYLFATIRNKKKYQNELQFDGLVHEPCDESFDLIPYGTIDRSASGFKIMVRYQDKGSYEYVDDLAYCVRYDKKRNKLFFIEAVEQGNKKDNTTAKKKR